MDVCESEKALRKHNHRTVETPRSPLVSAEKNNAFPTRRSATREIRSLYKSPTPATPSSPRRCPSPSLTRTTPTSTKLLPKRAQSAERKRPATPPSPTSPSTPSTDVHSSSRKVSGSRLPDTLWPSTMRSLSVSFQSDTISIPVSKKEKPVTTASDRTLRPASNVTHKQAETPKVRKSTPERKRSPLKGKNGSDQSENSKPFDGSHSRLIDQHIWPSRVGGKVSSSALNRSSIDHADKAARILNSSVPGTGISSLRRLSFPGEVSKPLEKTTSSDAARLLLLAESGRSENEVKSVDDCFQLLRPLKPVSTTPSDRTGLGIAGVKSQSLPSPRARHLSPIKTSVLPPSPSSSRGVTPTPSRPSTPTRGVRPSTPTRGVRPSTPTRGARPSTPIGVRPSTPIGVRPSTPPRGVSPSRIRPASSSNPPNNSISVLSFIADFKKGKKGAALIEDAHQLRLLYNRFLQWRFINARTEDAFYIQNVTAEKDLYNVWHTTLTMRESIIRKRINLQQLQLELKLNYVLNDQMAYLDDWAELENNHIDALSGAVEDLEASTLRLPLTGGAKVDIEQLKVAICSAVDIMQTMGSAIFPLVSRVEGMNNLISEVAVVSAQEKSMLDECEALLSFATAMQFEEYSLWTHLMQIKQALGVNK